MSIKKWVINDNSSVVQDSLRGLAMVNSGFVELVTCEDDEEGTLPIVALRGCSLSSSRVRILCGGGSGHEPAHAGFVCPEMLSAAGAQASRHARGQRSATMGYSNEIT